MSRATGRPAISEVAPRLPRRHPPAAGGRFGRGEPRSRSGNQTCGSHRLLPAALVGRATGKNRRRRRFSPPGAYRVRPSQRASARCGCVGEGDSGRGPGGAPSRAPPQVLRRLIMDVRLACVGQEPRQVPIMQAGGRALAAERPASGRRGARGGRHRCRRARTVSGCVCVVCARCVAVRSPKSPSGRMPS
jgi:hypothetical protein